MGKDEKRTTARDRDLWFGVAALQLHLIGPADLQRAAAARAERPDRDLGAALVEMGLLHERDRALIEQLLSQGVLAPLGDALAALMEGGKSPAAPELAPPPAASALLSFGGDTPAPAVSEEGPAARLDDTERVSAECPGRYTIKGEHGRGGIGRVLIAFDQHVGREVALKELLPPKRESEALSGLSPSRFTTAMARFLREARITGHLEHPGIVPVYEIAKRADGSIFYTMKLVRGQTLEAKIKAASGLAARLALLNSFLDLCQAMAYAHAKGVIHRDLKPANVMVGEFGETVVLDWGLAKVKGLEDVRATELEDGLRLIREASAGQTTAGQTLGTPSYMSPEQAEGKIKEIDERSDVWSLGALLYELLTGRPPFTGDLAYEVIGKVMTATVAPVASLEPQAPPELCAVAEKCLQRDRLKRYANAGELAKDVERFQAGGLVSAYEYSMAALAKRWVRKRWPVVVTVVAAVIALMVLGAWSFLQIRTQRNLAIQQKDLAVQREKESRQNLAEAFYQFGRRAEQDKRWNDARLYYAKSLTLADRESARSGLYLASVQPFKVGFQKSLTGHQFRVLGLAVSPDGKFLASASCGKENEKKECVQGQIKLWSLETGENLRTLVGHEDEVNGVAFSPDGKLLASAGRDSAIKIWSLATGECVRTIAVQGSIPYYLSVAFSPDGKDLLSGGNGSVLELHRADTGELIRSFHGHNPDFAVVKVAFSQDGKLALSGASDGEARLWSVADGTCLHAFTGHTYPIYSVAFSPDGQSSLTASWDKTLKLWSNSTGACLRTFTGHEDRAYAGAFSPDGKFVLSASRDKTLKLWQLDTGLCLETFTGHDDSIFNAAFLEGGRRMVSASTDKTIKLWTLQNAEPIRVLAGHQSIVWNTQFAPDEKSLLSVSGDNFLKLWSFPQGELIRVFSGHQNPASTAAFTPDGQTIISGSCHDLSNNLCQQGELKIWAAETGQCLKTLAVLPDWVNSLAVSPDGKAVATGSCSSRISMYKCAKGEINFWSLPEGRLVKTLTGHEGDIYSLAFTPDGKSLLSGSADRTLKRWSPETGACLRTFTGHEKEVDAIAISPDGKLALSSSLDRTAKLWDLETGAGLRTLPQGLFAVGFYPDGKYGVVGSWDNTLKLWSLATGNMILTFRGHEATVTSARFSRDGKYLVTSGDDKTVRIWPMKWDLFIAGGDQLLAQAMKETGLELAGVKVVPRRGE